MLIFSLKVCYFLLSTLRAVNSKVIYPRNAEDFKFIARKFVPETLAHHIANLVYQTTTGGPESEYNEESENDPHTDQESEYAEIHEKPSNGNPERILKINLDELVEKVKKRIVDDLDNGNIHPRVLKRGNKPGMNSDDDYGIDIPHEGDKDRNAPSQLNSRGSKNQNMRPKPSQKQPTRSHNNRNINKQPETEKAYDYPEPESVPAPKLKRQKTKSELYQITRLKSKKKKDSYEDYVIPPKEYDVYATEDEDKGKQNKRQEQEVQGQEEFVGEFLGDDTDENPKRVQNKRIQNKSPLRDTQGQEKDEVIREILGYDQEPDQELKRVQNKRIQNKSPVRDTQGQGKEEFIGEVPGDETQPDQEPKRVPNKRIQNKSPQRDTQGQEKEEFIGEILGDETDQKPKRVQNKQIQNKRPFNRPHQDTPERPLRNKNKVINSNSNTRPKQKLIKDNREGYNRKNKQLIKIDEEDGTPVKKRIEVNKKGPDYSEYSYQPANQQNFQVKKQRNKNVKPMRPKDQDYNDYGGPAQDKNAVPQYPDAEEKKSQGNAQPDYNEDYEKPVQKLKKKPQGKYQETTEYTEPTEVYVDDNPVKTTPHQVKMRTETIGDEEDEAAKAAQNNGGNNGSTTTQKQGTDIPTREVFKMITPDYYNKLPKIAEKYNFDEPIPDKDRVTKVTKAWVPPPAKINGKIKTNG